MASSNEMAPENDSDSSISMVDVLQEEVQLEEDAHAVLGDSDDRNCTYPMGYVCRQALYACATCSTEEREPAGLCLACSYECHEGHDLYELYTKRHFRCDCGNINRMPDVACKLYPNKAASNPLNKYNQNFRGLYCTCARPYPDPEDEVDDEMIQCIVCEDWLHGRHLGTKLPTNHDYQEMICMGCMKKLEFLWAYSVNSKATQLVVKTESSNNVEVCDQKNSTDLADSERHSVQNVDATVKSDTPSDVKAEVTSPDSSVTQSASQDNGTTSKEETSLPTQLSASNMDSKVADEKSAVGEAENSVAQSQMNINGNSSTQCIEQSSSEVCLLKELQKKEITVSHCSSFWPDGWRSKLCKCSMCLAMYKEKEVPFLVDASDSVSAYEERGRAKQAPATQYDKGLQALSNMGRVQQVEVLQGFHDLKTELSDYLRRFAENGKFVREEDIKEFFNQMEARKRQRTGPMQYLCK